MKLSKSKLALAKVINENGGWVDDSANWAAQPKHGGGDVWFSTSESKPYSPRGGGGFTFTGYGVWLGVVVKFDKLLGGWHQAVLSREEYYQAYPKDDADGWIEWEGGECPVDDLIKVEVKLRNHRSPDARMAKHLRWTHEERISCTDIIAYRLHKPEVKSDPRKSVTRNIPEPEEKFSDSTSIPRINQFRCKVVDIKPTIEQLAQDYRNAKDHADRLHKEAGEAAVKAESFAVEVRKKILELQELIG